MRILDRKLQRGAQLIGIERAVAGLIEPARIFGDEGFVTDLPPVADAGRVSCQISLVLGPIVGRALTREAHRDVGIAFAGRKAVAHGDDKNVAHLHRRCGNLAAADFDRDLQPARIGHGEFDGLVARLGDGIAADVLSTLGRGEPGACQDAWLIDTGQSGNDDMALRVHVVVVGGAGETVGGGRPAGLAIHARCPAVLVPCLQRALGREHGREPSARIECLIRGAMHFRVGRIGEETERVLKLPLDVRRGPGRRRNHAQRQQGRKQKPDRKEAHDQMQSLLFSHTTRTQHGTQPCAAPPGPARTAVPQTRPRHCASARRVTLASGEMAGRSRTGSCP